MFIILVPTAASSIFVEKIAKVFCVHCTHNFLVSIDFSGKLTVLFWNDPQNKQTTCLLKLYLKNSDINTNKKLYINHWFYCLRV